MILVKHLSKYLENDKKLRMSVWIKLLLGSPVSTQRQIPAFGGGFITGTTVGGLVGTATEGEFDKISGKIKEDFYNAAFNRYINSTTSNTWTANERAFSTNIGGL